MKADLHVHSTASDGTVRPGELVALALAAGIDVLALADHDSVEGIGEATSAAASAELMLIPAVELSTVADGGTDAHILGYFIDHTDPDLLAHLADLRAARLRRAEAMVGALSRAGYAVTLEAVLELSDGGAVGRSHVARALVSAGHASDVADAFRRLIGHGRPFYVRKDVRTPEEAIEIITSAGGLAVIAHPGVTGADELLEPLAHAGLAGVEAFHADHSEEQREHYASWARAQGLLVTGGTDFHGHHAPNPPLGSVDIPESDIAALLAAGAGDRS